MLVAMRFMVPPETAAEFAHRADEALAALAGRPGYLRGECGRAFDDAECWCLVTEWESVGAYRRALSAYEVKVSAIPLLAQAVDEPSAFETLLRAGPGGPVVHADSDRAPDPAADRLANRTADPGAPLPSRP